MELSGKINRFISLLLLLALLIVPLSPSSTGTAEETGKEADHDDQGTRQEGQEDHNEPEKPDPFLHGRDRSRRVGSPDNTVPDGYDVNPETQAKAKNGEYNKFFLKDDLQEIRVEINPDNLDYILQNAETEETALAKSVTIGGVKVENVGLRTKGNYTRVLTNESDSDRFSFTINFGKYVKKKYGYSETQNFFGCDKISLNNFYFDKTMMKEYAAFYVLSEMGIPTSQYGLAKLYINDEFYGVYFMVESIQESIIKQYLDTGNVSSFLMKPSGISPRFKDTDFGDCIDDDGVITLDALIENGFIVQNEDGYYSAKKELKDYRELWEYDGDYFNDNIEMIPKVLTWLYRLTQLSCGKDFEGYDIDVNSVRYRELLDQVVDTDEWLRYFAAHSFVVQMDNMFTHRQNFALYIGEDARSMLVPWDYDLAWGYEHNPADGESVANYDIEKLYNILTRYLGHYYSESDYASVYSGKYPYDENEGYPMFNVIYQSDYLREKFRTYAGDCAKIAALGGKTSDGKIYEPRHFGNMVDGLYDKLHEAASETLGKNIYYLQYDQPKAMEKGTQAIKQMVALRSVGVWLQANNIDAHVTGYGYLTGSLGDDHLKAPYSTGGDDIAVVDDATGIFIIADYEGTTVYRSDDGSGDIYPEDGPGPELEGYILDDKSDLKERIRKMAGDIGGNNENIAVYDMYYTKEAVSDYRIFIPIPSKDAVIYQYDERYDTLSKMDIEKIYDDHTAVVSTDDFRYFVVTDDPKIIEPTSAPGDSVNTGDQTGVGNPYSGNKAETDSLSVQKNADSKVNTEDIIKTPKTVIKKIKRTKSGIIRITWKKTSGNAGYQIQFGTDKKFRGARLKNIKSAKTFSTRITGFKKKKVFYFRIRTYDKDKYNIYYGKWSKVKKAAVPASK